MAPALVATLVAVVVGALCVAVTARRWRRFAVPAAVRAAAGVRLAAPVGREAALVRLRRLVGVMAAERLVQEVIDAPSRAHAVAALNESYHDARAELEADSGVPRSAARLSLASGTLLGIVELMRTLPGGATGVGWAAAALGSGLLGAGASSQLGRLAESRARAWRDEHNAVARLLLRLAPGDARADPAPDEPPNSERLPD